MGKLETDQIRLLNFVEDGLYKSGREQNDKVYLFDQITMACLLNPKVVQRSTAKEVCICRDFAGAVRSLTNFFNT